jgi:RNA polymerase sigma-70 factor (ECF subfamily)
MATDALNYPVSSVGVPAALAWPVRRVQSSAGMAATRAMGGTGRDGAGKDLERLQARAEEMELIREAQAGSRVAFDALVRQYEHQVLRLALHLTGSEHDAEDIYQEAFLKAYRYIGNFRFECSFYTWIYRIVTNLCLDQLRRKKTRREDRSVVVDHSGDEIDLLASVSDNRSFSNPGKELERKVLGERIQAALVKLTPRERMVAHDRRDAEYDGRDRQEYSLPGDEEAESTVGGVAVRRAFAIPEWDADFRGVMMSFEAGRT